MSILDDARLAGAWNALILGAMLLIGPDLKGQQTVIDNFKKQGEAIKRQSRGIGSPERFALFKRMVREGSDVIPYLVENLTDAEIREDMTLALMVWGKSSVQPLLDGLEKANNDDTRQVYITALGAIGPDAKKALPILKKIIAENTALRQKAPDAIVQIEYDPRLSEPLLQQGEESEKLLRSVIRITLNDDDRVYDFLFGNSNNRRLRDRRLVSAQIIRLKYGRGVHDAARVLGALGDTFATPYLFNALKENRFFSPVSGSNPNGPGSTDEDGIWGLVQMGSAAVPILLESLNDEFWSVRQISLRALGSIGPRTAHQAFGPLMERWKKETDDDLRALILSDLSAYDRNETIPVFTEALENPRYFNHPSIPVSRESAVLYLPCGRHRVLHPLGKRTYRGFDPSGRHRGASYRDDDISGAL